MNIVYLIGRIIFVALFLYGGVNKILDLTATADLISAKVPLPDAIQPTLGQIAATLNMSVPHLLALVAGVVEIVFALFIIFGIAIRFSAAVLLVYVLLAVFYGHPFWTMTGDARLAELNLVLLRLPVIGGLLIILGVGAWAGPVIVEGPVALERGPHV
jgi:uncharacterized membrane protein YphA (DoxX/SURF4 family)